MLFGTTSATAFVLTLLIAGPPAASAEFSRTEWSNPAQAGNALWIRNRRAKSMTIDTLYVRTSGFQGFGEVAFNAGPRRVYFALRGDPRGHWARLIPRDGGRLRVRARDSLMITGFECGGHLHAAREARRPAETFVLDLKIVDHRGGRAQVKIIQEPPNYRIGEAPDAVGKGAGGD